MGCIGMGGQGLVNLHNFLNFEEVRVVAVCDVHREGGGYLSWEWGSGKERRAGGREPARRIVDEFYAKKGGSGGCQSYADYRELLETEKDLDAVKVMTPDHLHGRIARWNRVALRALQHLCRIRANLLVNRRKRVTLAAPGNLRGRTDHATRIGDEVGYAQHAPLIQHVLGLG